MAIQPNKKKTNTTAKKKAPIRRRTVKTKTSKRKKKGHHKTSIITVLAVFLMIGFVMFGYYLGKGNTKADDTVDEYTESAYATKQLLDELAKVKMQKPQVAEKSVSQKEASKVVKSKPKVQEPKQVAKAVTRPSRPQPKARISVSKGKPKLVIIIDDVSKKSQLNAVLATGLKITPAIFPPSELSMTSNRLADGLKHSIIHLPMESSSKQFNSQYKTLLASASQSKIVQRAKELRRLFPHTKYVNNHTGSVFTNDKYAMAKLYHALRQEGFIFIDSRTIGSTKVKKIAENYGDAYVSRDIFIDNKHDIAYMHGQLQKAVKIAKKKGYAVAIGHPHEITMRALKNANNILRDVELVYIDDIYKEI